MTDALESALTDTLLALGGVGLVALAVWGGWEALGAYLGELSEWFGV